MTDKLTEALRAKCEEVAKDIEYWWPNLNMEGYEVERVSALIQRHMAPLVQSLRDERDQQWRNALEQKGQPIGPMKEWLAERRDEVIEECAEIADTTIVKQRIRALKGVR